MQECDLNSKMEDCDVKFFDADYLSVADECMTVHECDYVAQELIFLAPVMVFCHQFFFIRACYE